MIECISSCFKFISQLISEHEALSNLTLLDFVLVQLLFGFYDPSCRLDNPGWPLRNYLAFISLRCQDGKIQFLCYREKRGFADMGLSLVGEAVISPSKGRGTNDG